MHPLFTSRVEINAADCSSALVEADVIETLKTSPGD